MRIRTVFFIVMFFFFSGCSSVYIKTEAAPNIQIPDDTAFYLSVSDQTTIEEQKALQLLGSKLKQLGYRITKNKSEAVYWFAIKMNTPTYSSTTNLEFAQPKTTTHSGTVGNTRYSGTSTTTETKKVPITSRYSFKKTIIDLYEYDKSTDNLRKVWTSFTSIDSNLYKKNEEKIIAEVVKLLGKDFVGDLQLKQ